jgi:hypothetical protein
MAKSQHKSNKEVRKPKAEKVKTIAANASTGERRQHERATAPAARPARNGILMAAR